jgi:DMSO/TMAO reductase YedYZ molybdopterin-dependent catalytic subunit
LDCTLGWFTEQTWQGVKLASLLDLCSIAENVQMIRLESATGYAHYLPVSEARQVLLATHVGGEPLTHLHGAPLRAVVPTHRGWYWVKWLVKIEAAGGWGSAPKYTH